MTANRARKKAARTRAAETGENYTTALRHTSNGSDNGTDNGRAEIGALVHNAYRNMVTRARHYTRISDEVLPETQTWTFVGFWDDDDHLVIEDVLEGAVEDEREDDGEHEGGLFAASGTGRSQVEAWMKVLEEYDPQHPDVPAEPKPLVVDSGEGIDALSAAFAAAPIPAKGTFPENITSTPLRNAYRARQALPALEAYLEYAGGETIASGIQDLLSDLMHLCDLLTSGDDLDQVHEFEEHLASARRCYGEEVNGE